MMTTSETRHIAIDRTAEGQEMTADESRDTSKRARKPKARKFYIMTHNLRVVGAKPGYTIENEAKLLQGRLVLGPPADQRGFPDYPEPPRLLIDRKLGRHPPSDLEQYHEYWLVSDRTKTLFETCDPGACAFVKCDVRVADGSSAPVYWLCDVVRVLDALDESASRLKILQDADGKRYNFAGSTHLVFKEDLIGPMHIFRMAYRQPTVICDQQFKDACKAADLKGIQFRDAAKD